MSDDSSVVFWASVCGIVFVADGCGYELLVCEVSCADADCLFRRSRSAWLISPSCGVKNSCRYSSMRMHGRVFAERNARASPSECRISSTSSRDTAHNCGSEEGKSCFWAVLELSASVSLLASSERVCCVCGVCALSFVLFWSVPLSCVCDCSVRLSV